MNASIDANLSEEALPEVDGFGSLVSPMAVPAAIDAGGGRLSPREPSGGASSTLARAFEVLNLFSVRTPVLRIEDVVAKLGYTRSTAYRYVRELCEADLLTLTWNNQYVLGSRILELERLLQLTDPLYRAGSQVLRRAGREDSVFLLQSLHRDRVLCIYQEGPQVLFHEGRRVSLNRARGVPFPLCRGAASLAILAWLSRHRISQVYLSSARDIAESGLADDWLAFKGHLATIRRQGYASSRTGSPMISSLAVPIVMPQDRRVIGSLQHTVPGDSPPARDAESLAVLQTLSRDIAAEFARLVSEQDSGAVPPEAPAGRDPKK